MLTGTDWNPTSTACTMPKRIGLPLVSRTTPLIDRGNAPPEEPRTEKLIPLTVAPAPTGTGNAELNDVASVGNQPTAVPFGTWPGLADTTYLPAGSPPIWKLPEASAVAPVTNPPRG